MTDEYLSVKAVGWNNTPEGQVPCLMRSAVDLSNQHDKSAYSDYENNDENFRKQLCQILITKVAGARKNPKILQGRSIPFCFKNVQNSVEREKNQVHTRSLHAEENAFLQISKYGGQAIKNGKLFTTASPCELCAKKAYQLGIKEIIYIDQYPGIADRHILGIGENRPTSTLFSGAIGRAYHQLYQPILPYKDELQMLLGFEWFNKYIKSKNEKLKSENEKLKSENAELKRSIQNLTERKDKSNSN